jgi:nucleotide-binding universal stress UspA family protein
MNRMNNEADSKSVVLVGIDFSEHSGSVLRAAADIAGPAGSELHLVHVLSSALLGTSRADRELAFANELDRSRQELDRFAMQVASSVKRVAGHLRVGQPDVEMAQLASDIGADLIVVGTHGRSGVDRLFLGSVAESLVRHAPCPVFTWRPKAVAIWNQIAPPCPDCLAVQQRTARATLWCDRHSQHHPRAHTYYEVPNGFGAGAQTFLNMTR